MRDLAIARYKPLPVSEKEVAGIVAFVGALVGIAPSPFAMAERLAQVPRAYYKLVDPGAPNGTLAGFIELLPLSAEGVKNLRSGVRATGARLQAGDLAMQASAAGLYVGWVVGATPWARLAVTRCCAEACLDAARGGTLEAIFCRPVTQESRRIAAWLDFDALEGSDGVVWRSVDAVLLRSLRSLCATTTPSSQCAFTDPSTDQEPGSEQAKKEGKVEQP